MGYGPDAPVPVFQHEAEFTELLEIYRARRPSRTLEVGTYHGGTLYHWLQNAPVGSLVVSVDSFAMGVDNRKLFHDWCAPGVSVHAIEGDSHDPDTVRRVGLWAPYDWVFIDADHYYDSVKADWEAYLPLARPGGVVVFHDILDDRESHPEIEVADLWREIKQAGFETREIVEDPRAPWGGLGVVFLP